MKAAGISEIKQELTSHSAKSLLDVCLRLARAKKENKELLTYLLFEAHDQEGYVAQLKSEIDESLAEVSKNNYYILKKSLQRILRMIGKHVKFMASRSAEAELLLYFCNGLHKYNIPYQKSTVLHKLYHAQLKKISAAIGTLHEDLQHDLTRQLNELS